MNKKLLLGLGIGLVAYYFLMRKGKGNCNCEDELALPSDSADKRTACEKQADAGMKNVRFISAEAMARYRKGAIEDCMKAPVKGQTKKGGIE